MTDMLYDALSPGVMVCHADNGFVTILRFETEYTSDDSPPFVQTEYESYIDTSIDGVLGRIREYLLDAPMSEAERQEASKMEK